MKEMITSDGQANILLAEGVRIIGASLVVNDNVSYEQMELAIQTLCTLDRLTQWCIGDAINASERIFGEKYTQMIAITNMEVTYLMVCASMANAFPPADRRNISFSHHRLVQKFDKDKRNRYLQVAIDNQMPLAEFAKWIKEREGQDKKQDGDDRNKAYVIAKRTVPVQRGDIWEVLSDPDAINIDEEKLKELGLGPLTAQDSVYVIAIRYQDDEPDQEQAEMDMQETDDSVTEGKDSGKVDVPFG